MFAKTVIDSDAFLDMPCSAQALYFHLAMRADDDGFLNNPRKVQRMVGAADDDLKILLAKRFVISFDTGIVVIKHWKIHNYIQKDRYKPTVYTEEKDLLKVKPNGAYTLDTERIQDVSNLDTERIQDVSKVETQVRLGKVRLGKGRLEDVCTEQKTAPVPPAPPVYTLPLNDGSEWELTQEQYNEYVNLYQAVDVMCELRKMRGWLNANPERRKTKRGVNSFVNRWLSKEQDRAKNPGTAPKKPQTRFHNFEERQDDSDEEMALAMMRNRLK